MTPKKPELTSKSGYVKTCPRCKSIYVGIWWHEFIRGHSPNLEPQTPREWLTHGWDCGALSMLYIIIHRPNISTEKHREIYMRMLDKHKCKSDHTLDKEQDAL